MTLFEVNARIIVDVTSRQMAETYRDDMLSTLPSWTEVVAAEGTVSTAQMMPLVTNGDLDRRYDDLLNMARRLNQHATTMEERVVEARLRLTRGLHRDLNRLVDDLDAHRG